MNCAAIATASYPEFAKRLFQSSVTNQIPLQGSIELTSRCNLSCRHCYINQPAIDIKLQEKELSFDQLCNILDQLAEQGCMWLLISGGEPMIHPDFFKTYVYAKKKGFLVTLFTNGTLITSRVIQFFQEWPPHKMEISIYGATESTYETISGVKGSFKKCMRGIKWLSRYNIPFQLKSMAMTLNQHEIGSIEEFARMLKVDFRVDALLNMRLDGGKSPQELRLSPKKIVKLDLQDKTRIKDLKEFCGAYLKAPPKPENLYQCGTGINSFHIDPYGNMSLCLMSRKPNFNLQNSSFKNIWFKELPNLRNRKRKMKTPCQTCSLINLCGWCPGVAELENGDPESPVEYLCQVAQERNKMFEKIIMEEGHG